MIRILSSRLAIAAALAFAASSAMAAPVGINTSNASNGLADIYSTTFDGAQLPCGGVTYTIYCTFFGGDPGPTRAIVQTPTPSGVVTAVPGGIGPLGIPVAPAPASGSFLDLTLGGGNTTLTLGGGSAITFGDVNLKVGGGAAINANAHLAGMVFNAPGGAIGGALTPAGGGSTGGTVTVGANPGEFVFEVNGSPGVMVDFSRFSQVVTSCTGTLCGLIAADLLNLDMVRYVLQIDYDPTFTSFTGKFIGQTSNNSLVCANLSSTGSGSPGACFQFVPVPAAGWLMASALGLLAGVRRRVVKA